ncbi:MAG TPA: D-2-hydroxyacid dehydrogenase [Bryobacteraceae bacterium]|nr:D-2-hydroxyacid dehydrogenase [Bryobacteraceae bacterium]
MSLLNSTCMRRLILLLAACALAASAQTKKILVMGGEDIEKELQTAVPQARIVPVTHANVMQEIADADGFVGDIRPEEVRAAKKLKWVQTMSAGVEGVLFLSGGNDLRDSNIVLTNNKIVQGPEIADHAMALLLSLTRRLPRYMKEMPDESLDRRAFDGIELRGKTAVVIGVGGIGMQIAQRAWAFGMTVIGVDPEDKPFSPFLADVVKPDQIDEVIPKADVVFISAPHTERSHKEMGSHEFELMKPHSYFIAVSRGGVYDMNGLVKGLDSRRLAGAGVDVTDPEPLPKGHPLWKFDNVIITPHIAGRSDKDRDRMVGTVKENLERFVDGKPLVNVVDKQKGY